MERINLTTGLRETVPSVTPWREVAPDSYRAVTPARGGNVWKVGNIYRWSVFTRRPPGGSIDDVFCLAHGETAEFEAAKSAAETVLGASEQ
jgi:hypothetical protein